MSNRFYIFLIAFFYCSFLFAQKKDPLKAENHQDQKHWVDSLYNSMTLKEKVAQLFVLQLMTKNDNSNLIYKQISRAKAQSEVHPRTLLVLFFQFNFV